MKQGKTLAERAGTLKDHVLAAGLSILLMTSGTTAYAGGNLALQCGNVVDPAQPAVQGQTTILLKGKLIDRVVKGLVSPDGYEIVDLKQKTCVPGLIDTYVHLSLSIDQPIALNVLGRSNAAKALLALKNAQTALRAGFTTILDGGEPDYHFATVDLRNAINAGMFEGPRVLVAPHGISSTGGHGDMNELPSEMRIKTFSIESGVDNAREAVRRERRGGADWIKVFVTGGILNAGDSPRIQDFTNEEIAAFADEAHRLGMKIMGSALSEAAVITASNAGYDVLLHPAMITDKAVKVMVKNGTWMVPHIYATEWIAQQAAKGAISNDARQRMRDHIAENEKALRTAYKGGVKLAFGADPPLVPHQYAPREFAALVRHGVSPRDAMAMATINAATLLGLEREIGSLEAGKHADIVAVPGNPLEEITVMEQVGFVMKSGAIVRNDF